MKKMQKLTPNQIKTLKKELPSKYSKSRVAFYDISGKYANLYDKEQGYITAVDPGLLEYVTAIDNRLDTQFAGSPGKPEYKEFIMKRKNTRVSIKPSGASWWYHIPYTGPADFQRFLLALDAHGDAVSLSSEFVRTGVISVKAPSQSEGTFSALVRKSNSNLQRESYTAENRKSINESRYFI